MEELTRKKNFLKQQRQIEKHNRENNGWKMAHSRFSDMVSAREMTTVIAIFYSCLVTPNFKDGRREVGRSRSENDEAQTTG